MLHGYAGIERYAVSGLVIVAATLVARAVLTEGYTEAGRRVQIALGVAVVLAGVVLVPAAVMVVIGTVNAAWWIAYGLLYVAIGVLLLAVLIAILFSAS